MKLMSYNPMNPERFWIAFTSLQNDGFMLHSWSTFLDPEDQEYNNHAVSSAE